MRCFPPLLFIRRSRVQQGKITLPAHSHHTCEEGSVLRHDICKVESSDRWPELAAVDETCWHGSLDPLPCAGDTVAREQGLHAEEIAIEDGSEDDLVDDNFGGEGEDSRGIVEQGA